ncbi:unnamed protein product [Tuber melanosporum]|uniref:(Perigord truffle) hypothetical protein n=1 Tax=Tuber melanosporum (strain Mel28) TaxID=656061 RepID=D5GHI0_TUBMM|nr:uncharacterized protein GSTUM_00007925001 [Tuber melanosporum]CAZ83973.1 unnamed protein product [Tuber melanosporum]
MVAQDTPLIAAVKEFVNDYMSKYDSSHNYQHIERVLAHSLSILHAAQASPPETHYDENLVILLALLHDVGDKKYSTATTTTSSTAGPAEDFLLSAGASPDLASLLQKLINNLSYSHEQTNPQQVAELVKQHPELAIVQDADRLDAIGAVGVGRTFTFGAIKNQEGGMGAVIRHFDEKLLKLADGMKTVEGRRIARERGERVKAFREWWREEAGE